ncbi:hypothetical protein Hanom_Chr02g00132921 [Helianthus anomalus]
MCTLGKILPFCYNSAVAWCGKLNAISCASETCARIPRYVALFCFYSMIVAHIFCLYTMIWL